jgi:hypothetical protein
MAETAPTPKTINMADAFDKLLGQGRLGSQKVIQAMEKYEVTKKVSGLKEHPVAQKVVNKLMQQQAIVFTVIGFVLVIQGAQFKNLLLCTQILLYFFFERAKKSTLAVYNSMVVASEKISADAGDEHPSATPEEKNKHAAKRDAAKKEAAAAAEAEKMKDASASAKKILKSVNAEIVKTAALDLFFCWMGCLMVIRGGLARSLAVSHGLVRSLARLQSLFKFADEDDKEIKEWSELIVQAFLHIVFLFLSTVMGPFAIAMNASAVGACLILDNGLPLLEATGKIPKATALANEIWLGLIAFGSLWQTWNWMAGDGLAWYFQMLYIPAVAVEALISRF